MTPYRFPRLVQHTLVNTATLHPQQPAVVTARGQLEYGELLRRARCLAATLRRLDVGPREPVVLFLENDLACCVSIYASLFAGTVFVVVNPQTPAEKLAFIIDDCAAAALVTEAHLLRTAAPAASGRPTLRAVICDGERPSLEGLAAHSFEEALAGPELDGPDPVIPLDLAALVYTSGTTGTPKGVMISQQSMLFTIGSLCDYLTLDATDRILSVLPLAFTYGLYQLLTATAVGATLNLERSFTYPARVLERLAATASTTVPGVPSIFARLIAMHRKEPLRFPSVRRVTNAAAALPEAHLPVIGEIFPNAAVFPMYGQTECARACFLSPELVSRKPGSVGKAIPGTELLIRSPEGAPVPTGEVGILHVRGPHVMAGYWHRPEETVRTLVPGPLPGERMLCTHDWFRVDDEGCHYFVGRSDDIIKTRGEKVSPAEVESVLCGIDGVVEAAVIGVPDEIMGEAVRAHVVLEEGATLGAKDLEAACRQRLEIFMVPRDFIIEAELPKTANGKVSKRDLRARAG